MKINRRNFIKGSGVLVAATGLGCAADKYSDSIPEENQKRWAMVIDIGRCKEEEGCTKCIQACHLSHNVPSIPNEEEEIKWIWKDEFADAFPTQEISEMNEELRKTQVLLLCNHCENPPCVRVCPTQATWKREKDGIVMMDMHRCIGCRYCMAACPYGSRSFNWQDPREFLKEEELNKSYPSRTKGVVEKCNFCADIIHEDVKKGVNPVPKCVAACPVGAMIFGDLNDPESEVSKKLKEKYTIRRKPSLGTEPEVYYIV